jgi:hypothetical protein
MKVLRDVVRNTLLAIAIAMLTAAAVVVVEHIETRRAPLWAPTAGLPLQDVLTPNAPDTRSELRRAVARINFFYLPVLGLLTIAVTAWASRPWYWAPGVCYVGLLPVYAFGILVNHRHPALGTTFGIASGLLPILLVTALARVRHLRTRGV